MILPFTVRPALYLKMIKEHWKVITWVTLLQTVINYSLFYQGLKLVPGAIGAVLSWLLITNEKPEWLTVTGIAIIIISLILYYKTSKEVNI